jgi:hypothetical protein
MSARDKRVALLRLAYEAFNRRDVDAVLSMLDPEVEWPNLLDRATAHGPDPVREYWNRQFKQIDPTSNRRRPFRFGALMPSV